MEMAHKKKIKFYFNKVRETHVQEINQSMQEEVGI